MTDLIGQHLGQYDVIDQIGKGGMSTVYRARQKTMKRDVAIKILPAVMAHNEALLERFYREVEIVASLQHPHILPVYDFGEYDGLPYIVMAYMSGGTLADQIPLGPMSPATVIDVVNKIAGALDYAHSKGVIHRDFKPSNVLLDEQNNPYLSDFGLAKLSEASMLTGTSILGTPTYMAPEQANSQDLTPAADVYALGVTVFQMLTGHAPYEAPTPMGVLMAHATKPIPDIRMARPDLPVEVQAVIAKSLAKPVEERYPTPGAMASALSFALSGKNYQTAVPETRDALLMTNMLGHVIFVDQSCLKMLKYHHNEARHVIGKPLAALLGIDAPTVEKLMGEIAKNGRVENRVLDIKDASGQTLAVTCTALATRDDKATFVGADISLRPLVEITAPVKVEDFDTVHENLDSKEERYLQTYFTAQVEGLRDMLLQLGGRRLSTNLENIINETAERNVWSVTVQNGKIVVGLKSSDADIYKALLAKVVAYSTTLVGERMVAKQMQSVDKKMDARVLELVRDLRLHELFTDLL